MNSMGKYIIPTFKSEKTGRAGSPCHRAVPHRRRARPGEEAQAGPQPARSTSLSRNAVIFPPQLQIPVHNFYHTFLTWGCV